MFKSNLPRGIIFLLDMGIVSVSLIVAYFVRFNFTIPPVEVATFYYVIPSFIAVRALCFYIFKTYSGIIRYTSTKDVQRIVSTLLAGSVFFSIINPISFYITGNYVLPYTIIIIEFLLSVFIMTSTRMLIKILYMETMNPSKEKTNVIIFGAGEAGVIAKRTLDRDAGSKYKVLAFVDDNYKKSGKKVEGVSIYDTDEDLERLLAENEVQHLIISIQNLAPARKQEIVEMCLRHHTKVLTVPPVTNWINGALSFKQIKKIRIEDLLERDPIRLDTAAITSQLTGKTILITGAAGSIGSEIVRQVLRFNPAKVIMLDCAESPMYDLELETSEMRQGKVTEPVIADIRNHDRMLNVFRTFRPQIVFHAAAYKHVPMMENNPSEAILTNVKGTRITAELSDEFGVEKFVMVSTDKAVNPTSIMGATKRIAEIYIQSLNKKSKTKFITTRFGNVLGSNGSVIPRFNKQIESRQPITITHPEITRFFMTIPEACQLVLEAGAMGKGGEIFIFDMGKSVKITDLAKKMVQLSGLELGKDIQLVFTGLRPGEKLYEELLNNEENTIPTHHEKIMVAKVKEYDFDEVKKNVDELVSLFNAQDNINLVRKMKEIVPEYISNNSVFEVLDKDQEMKSA
ncbi:MAG: polysaccharide biosynthesis protein [Bacteroidetes bacterium]|nr:polysaccharide biosynthesis protein [Bacteroidota bacterium]MBK9423465.1 polysaccharide biosynthesis protein [Bacteroidota bacterium]